MYKKTDWVSFATITRRETQRFFRLWIQTILPSAITSVLYFIIFGNLIGRNLDMSSHFTYMEFIVPGLIMMSIINNSYSNVVSSFYGAKFGRHIEEILVSPTPNSIILMGYLSGGILRGVVVGAVVACLAWLFSPVHLAHPLLMLIVVILTSTLFSLAGFINAVFAQKFDDISWVPTFVLTPLTYLGGVFYSVALLSPFWQKISLFNPILYMVDAFRYSTLGVSDISIVFTLSLITGLTAVLYVAAYTLLVKGIGIRS